MAPVPTHAAVPAPRTAPAAADSGKVAAIDRSQAVIEFDLTGRILTANSIFCASVGYELEEITGKHHRIFCDPEYAASLEYADFWSDLAAGRFNAGEFRRIAKGGRELWLQATYSPILDAEGKPYKVVKFASDITAVKASNAEFIGKVAAIDRAQAVVEFYLDGTIITANQNFCDAVGYRLSEIEGKHHRVFCDSAYTQTRDYADFWERLGAGEFETGEFRRLKKNGDEIWLQASYNPILGADGKPFKVVKFAADVSAAKLRNAEIEARIDAVDRSQAVIEFDLDGIVLSANDNFLRAMGYSLREIAGKHHSQFCSEEYREFWLKLGKGESIAGRFHRVGNYGRDVYIHATYTPVLDLSGRPFKVVKYAFDVTDQVEREKKVAQGARDMTSTVRNLATSIDEISRSSRTANDLAQETQGNAEQGVEALRASLEAIEHGVGFSIVAGEVRKLAERSFEAAQQIGKLIEESAERVHQGSEVSKRAEGAFERIASSVSRTNDAIRVISECTRVQQEASREVDALITELSTVDNAS